MTSKKDDPVLIDGDHVVRRTSPLADIGPRLGSAIVMAAAALVTTRVGGDVFVVFWLLVGIAVHWEWQNLIGGPARLARFLIGACALAAAAYLTRQSSPELVFPILVLGACVVGGLAGVGRRLWAAAGVVYAAALVVATIGLRLSLFDGLDSIIWLFAVVWGADVLAYFGGRLVGGPKLWPRVSPSKTWSGFLIGVVCGSLAGLVVLALAGALASSSAIALLVLGLAAAVVSQGGDLFESSLKRRFGVKDSSKLIPGHGGFMDRLDGFIAASAFAAAVGAIHQGSGAIAMGLLRW